MIWQEITTVAEVEQALQTSKQPVLFFKHSARCPICVHALRRIEEAWTEADGQQVQACIIHVRKAREASDYLAATYQVEHHSPQVLLFRSGTLCHHASHESIQYVELKAHINTA